MHIDDLAAQVGNVLADVLGTELVCRTVEILRQLHPDVVPGAGSSSFAKVKRNRERGAVSATALKLV